MDYVELGKKAKEFVKQEYDLLSEDEKKDILVLDEGETTPSFEELDWEQLCAVLGAEELKNKADNIVDILFYKEFAEYLGYSNLSDFVKNLDKLERDYLMYTNVVSKNDEMGKPDFEGEWGYAYYIAGI